MTRFLALFLFLLSTGATLFCNGAMWAHAIDNRHAAYAPPPLWPVLVGVPAGLVAILLIFAIMPPRKESRR